MTYHLFMGKKSESKKQNKNKLDLVLTHSQVEHIRDLLSVVINQETDMTLSEHLAKNFKRSRDERALWEKVVELCVIGKLAHGDDAPDFVIAASPPQIGIMMIDPDEKNNDTSKDDANVKCRPIFSCDEDK
jgi:hypothetical protein